LYHSEITIYLIEWPRQDGLDRLCDYNIRVAAVFASERFHDYFILGLGMHYSQALEG
jgi:hypothetical protein